MQAICGIPGLVATVVTFDPHPYTFFTGRQRPLLTPRTEKAQQLAWLGIEQLLLLPFDQALAQLSAEQFVQEIVIDALQASQIAVGADFRFGQQRRGDAQVLKTLATAAGAAVTIAPLEVVGNERISSSAIRQALDAGAMAQVTQLLGRPYCLMGEVIQGQQLGRTLGFPTANLQVPPEKYLPRSGVYQVRVESQQPGPLPPLGQLGVMNLGCRPSVTATGQTTIEVHLLNWSGDLYGQQLTVKLERFLRPEQKFASLAELQAQIRRDCAIAQTLTPV